MVDWKDICDQIELLSGIRADGNYVNSVGGGCISSAFLVGKPGEQIFIKTNRRDSLSMFEAESFGLGQIADANAVTVPQVYCTGRSQDIAFIAMQAIEFKPCHSAQSYRDFGHQLAAMHRHLDKRFGSEVNNTIGSTHQPNNRSSDWLSFWRTNRLEYQLALAKNNSAPFELLDSGYRLGESMAVLFESPPDCSCLHGDLWSGNWGFDTSGRVVIFDPAHYYGDRETDIAMTKLFGSAHADFYAAYMDAYPMRPNYLVRETFYNIYHILNHYNLFGGSYANQALQMIKQTLSELH